MGQKYTDDSIQESQKLIFLNQAKRLADEYGLNINWNNFDYDHGLIEFLGDIDDCKLMEFLAKLSDFGDI